MRALRRWLIRLAGSIAGRDRERLREELEEHLLLQTDAYVRAGLPPGEARRQARLKLGAVEALDEHYRHEQGLPVLDNLHQDLRYTFRQLRRAPLFTAMATLSLAIGIGANAAIFTVVDRVLLRSLPVAGPHELVFVTDQRSSRDRSPRFSYPFYLSVRDTTALNGVAARFTLPVNLSIEQQALRPRGELVSGNYFRVLGVAAGRGRPLTPDDDRTPGAHPVAVISESFWQRSFAADPSVVGREVRINNVPFTIVGIAARGFTGTEVGIPTDIWLPLAMQKTLGRDLLTAARTNWLEMIGRLKPGTSLEGAAAALDAGAAGVAGAGGAPARQLVLVPAGKGSSPVRRELGPMLRMLLALTGLALLLSSVNLAGLLVVRSETRQREIAVRLALGASRWTLARQSLVETLTLSALGGTAGLLVAPWAVGLLVAAQPERMAIEAGLDLRVFAFGLAASVLTGLIIGQAPIFASSRIGLTQAFGNAVTTPRTRGRLSLRDVMVAGQIAASLVMLIGGALLIQSLRTLSSVDPGVRARNLLLLSVDPGSAGYNATRIEAFWRSALERVQGIPGVRDATLAGTIPFAPGRQRQPARNPASGDLIEIDSNFVGPGYFRTLDVPLLAGREFDATDGRSTPRVVIVNERMARTFWPAQEAVGKAMVIGPPSSPPAEVVGVVKDVKYRDLRADADPMMYLPILQIGSTSAMTLHVRAASDPTALIATIRREMRELDPNLPLFGMVTLDEQLQRPLAPLRQAAVLTGGFGVLALLLSAIGVYSVTALAVSRRTREIGIRTALGARPGAIVRVIGRRAVGLVVAGLLVGIAGSVWFGRIADALLYGITAGDPTTFAAMSALLAAVSLAAVALGVRTATRHDPLRAIRSE